MKVELDENKIKAYSYILGLYLGDGYINKTARTYRLRIALDKKYSQLNSFAKMNLQTLFPSNKIGIINFKGHINLSVFSNKLPLLFPQHGSGPKHLRSIVLDEWQKAVLDEIETLRGLFHSDGSFYKETISQKYVYERYLFTNKSNDIQKIFQEYCSRINISFDVQTKKDGVINTRISKKNDVNKLKQLIGIKE